jgi:hypothetical protein
MYVKTLKASNSLAGLRNVTQTNNPDNHVNLTISNPVATSQTLVTLWH